MPKGASLTQTQINRRLQDLRNKTALHTAARQRALLLERRVKRLEQENKDLRDGNKDLQQQLKEAQEKKQ